MRKTMTEILLKVTNEQIEQVCKEERQRYIKKRKGIVFHPTLVVLKLISCAHTAIETEHMNC